MSKLKPIFFEIQGKRVLLGTVELEELSFDSFNPGYVTDLIIKKINLDRDTGKSISL